MKEVLDQSAYEATKAKLQELESRLAEMKLRKDLTPDHLASVCRSYHMMIREYLQDIRLYETHVRRSAS